ncbi:MAG: 2-oxoacid:acceptor oxidoreductase family protein [Bdellovibrio sp.]
MWFFKRQKALSIPLRPGVAIRMEAIGGQGANSSGKILAEAAVLKSDFTGNHFSSFGSEKRGSPVRSFVRFSTEKKVIRSASFIDHPDLLIIFHESLIVSHPEILQGVSERTDIVINSPSSPRQIRFPQGTICRTIATISAVQLARQLQCGQNAVLLGAAARFCPEISSSVIRETLGDFFQDKGVEVIEKNLSGFDAGSAEVAWESFSLNQASLEATENALPDLGWRNAPIGGVITNPGNSVLKNHSASRRGVVPQLKKEICFNCGYCDMVCPDFCFVWDIDPLGERSPTLKGIDYQYCKGCQKCVAVCPVDALKPVLESNLTSQDLSVKAYPEVDFQLIQERWKHMDWVAYVDKISEKERMLTPQTELLNPATYLRPRFSEDMAKKKKDS